MPYAIEDQFLHREPDLTGPFDTAEKAVDWALKNATPPWRLRNIAVPEIPLSEV